MNAQSILQALIQRDIATKQVPQRIQYLPYKNGPYFEAVVGPETGWALIDVTTSLRFDQPMKWVQTCKKKMDTNWSGKGISVKSVIYYRGKSLKSYEEELERSSSLQSEIASNQDWSSFDEEGDALGACSPRQSLLIGPGSTKNETGLGAGESCKSVGQGIMCKSAIDIYPRFAKIAPNLYTNEAQESQVLLSQLSIQVVDDEDAPGPHFLIVGSENLDAAYRFATLDPNSRVVGIECLRFCVSRHMELPLSVNPVLSCKLKGQVVLFSGLTSGFERQLCSFVECMQGVVADKLSLETTHLVTQGFQSESSRLILEIIRRDLWSSAQNTLRIVEPKWVLDCWYLRNDTLPAEIDYCVGLPIFQGAIMCFTGFPAEETIRLCKLATTFGSGISAVPTEIDSCCTHLITNHVKGNDLTFACLHSIAVMTKIWLEESCRCFKQLPHDLCSSELAIAENRHSVEASLSVQSCAYTTESESYADISEPHTMGNVVIFSEKSTATQITGKRVSGDVASRGSAVCKPVSDFAATFASLNSAQHGLQSTTLGKFEARYCQKSTLEPAVDEESASGESWRVVQKQCMHQTSNHKTQQQQSWQECDSLAQLKKRHMKSLETALSSLSGKQSSSKSYESKQNLDPSKFSFEPTLDQVNKQWTLR